MRWYAHMQIRSIAAMMAAVALVSGLGGCARTEKLTHSPSGKYVAYAVKDEEHQPVEIYIKNTRNGEIVARISNDNAPLSLSNVRLREVQTAWRNDEGAVAVVLATKRAADLVLLAADAQGYFRMQHVQPSSSSWELAAPAASELRANASLRHSDFRSIRWRGNGAFTAKVKFWVDADHDDESGGTNVLFTRRRDGIWRQDSPPPDARDGGAIE